MITEEQWGEVRRDLARQMGAFCLHYRVDPNLIADAVQTAHVIAQTDYDPARGKLLRFCTDVGRHFIIEHARKRAAKARYITKTAVPEAMAMITEQVDPMDMMIRQEEQAMAKARWDLLCELMGDGEHAIQAEILDIMYHHVIMHGKVPSRRQIAKLMGKSHPTIIFHIKRIIQAIEENGNWDEDETTPPTNSLSGL